MPVATEFVLETHGRKVPYREWGSGAPLLYLHSFEGPPVGTRFFEGLSAGHRVVAPVHPGFEGTRDDPDLHDILNVVVFYQEVLDALGAKQADIIGHGLGGMFAAELAAVAPARVRRLVLVSPFGLWLDQAPLPDVLSAGGGGLARMLWANPAGEAAAVEQRGNIERTANVAAATNYLWPIPDRGLSTRLHRLTMPVLLVRGEADGIVSRAYIEAYAARLPDARLVEIEGAAHYPMLEQPEAFAGVVAKFLAD